jgi:hypothetical protein
MIGFYLIALIPAIIGLALYLYLKEVNWLEWLGGSAIAFIVAGIVHLCTIYGLLSDTETWSGRITKAVHYPKWVERYTETHTRTEGSGKNARTVTYTDTHYRTHPEHWNAETDIDNGATEAVGMICGLLGGIEIKEGHEITKDMFNQIRQMFNDLTIEKPYKSGFYSGDRNIYVAYNKTGYIYPVTDTKQWENKLKGSKTLFKFIEVPKHIKVYDYPKNQNFMASDRLCGLASVDFNLREFDLMNTRLGPTKKVNVIICGWESGDDQLGHYQEAKWKGGKKNDLVITYGSIGGTCCWAHVFSWSERQDVKRELETLFMSNKPGTGLIPKIENSIKEKYTLKDWSKFDYVTVDPPWWCYLILVAVMIMAQAGFWFYAFTNEFHKR